MRVERLRAAARGGIYALLLIAPLPFGSVTPGWVLAIELAAAALGLVAILLVSYEPAAYEVLPRAPLAICGALIALGIFQVIPFPFSIAEKFNPTADLLRPLLPYLGLPHPPTVAWSVAAPETTDAVLRLIAYVLVGITAAVAFDTEVSRRRFAGVLVASAALQAVYGSSEYLTGSQHIFGFAKKYYLDSATGTFINRNHFATLLAIALPFALVLAIPRTARRHDPGWRARVLALGNAHSVARILAAFACAVIWLGLLLSHSRAGLLAALAGAGIVLFHFRSTRAARWTALVGACVLLALLTVEAAQAPGARFATLKADLADKGGRLAVWRDTMSLVRARPVLGWGFGTFDSAFPSVQSAGIEAHYDHAHNDWLELGVEGGFLALFCATALWILAFRSSSQPGRAALVAVALHSVWDFSLRIPAIAILFGAAVGVGIAGRFDGTQNASATLSAVGAPRPSVTPRAQRNAASRT